ncbi:unnamed protein product, partial [Amoebophrya sp. A120]|eukprot:GSA120T00000972001.1
MRSTQLRTTEKLVMLASPPLQCAHYTLSCITSLQTTQTYLHWIATVPVRLQPSKARGVGAE